MNAVRTSTLLAALSLMLPACGVVRRAGVAWLSERATLPAEQILRELSYVESGDDLSAGVTSGDAAPSEADQRHRLDFYLPTGRGWPVLVFVHGGGWDSGDKNLRVGGLDVYGNIGRAYAAQGIGVAVINYRLQPSVTWREQVQDVAAAAAWVHRHAAPHGGDPDRLFLAGHSAGAHLAAHAALNQDVQRAAGLPPGAIKGFVAVSGAGYDIVAPRTYELGADPAYYEQRFKGREADLRWKVEASPLFQAEAGDPSALILYAEGEAEALKFQAKRFQSGLAAQGLSARLLSVPGESHARIVLALSHPRKTALPAIRDFVLEDHTVK